MASASAMLKPSRGPETRSGCLFSVSPCFSANSMASKPLSLMFEPPDGRTVPGSFGGRFGVGADRAVAAVDAAGGDAAPGAAAGTSVLGRRASHRPAGMAGVGRALLPDVLFGRR